VGEPYCIIGRAAAPFSIFPEQFQFLRGGAVDLLTTIGIILLVLWLAGLVSSYTLGGFIHVLLVIALVVILIRVLQGRRSIP